MLRLMSLHNLKNTTLQTLSEEDAVYVENLAADLLPCLEWTGRRHCIADKPYMYSPCFSIRYGCYSGCTPREWRGERLLQSEG